EVSGKMTIDGKPVVLQYAYRDDTDPEEPIVVLSDQALPAEAVPFVPGKLVKDKQLHALAFSVSRKDRKLTNTFGKVYCPGHEMGVGLGRVEEGNVALTIDRLDAASIAGGISTVKPVKLSYVAYEFDLKFRTGAGQPKP
ncbi:MAG TPA: hypothetical protein VFL12_02825, partial [Thermoanaerobaculia bacterium]|nr:hypothetical protein [Thermoanaerobaculia bacterium]